jgi:RNA polymerase sigma-70 factor (ECF subfamily)
MDMPSAAPNGSLERYREYLHLLVRLRLGSPDGRVSASDLVQETLFKAFRNQDQFRGQSEAEWRAYLRRILANTIADAFRAKANVNEIQLSLDRSSDCIDDWLRDDALSPSQQAQHRERSLALAAGLAQLSPDERLAIELRYLQEPRWSLPEIAKHLNRPTAKAVSSLLARGIEKLRSFMRDDDGEMP